MYFSYMTLVSIFFNLHQNSGGTITTGGVGVGVGTVAGAGAGGTLFFRPV